MDPCSPFKVVDLGLQLYDEGKYSEAEGPLRLGVEQLEAVHGRDYKHTLLLKYYLGCTLFMLHRYSESEVLLRHAADRQRKTLGKYAEATLDSNFHLAHTLYKQEEYSQAEELFRKVADRRERVLGTHNEETIDSIYWVARVLYRQNKFGDAEKPFRKAVERRERTLGKDDKDTVDGYYWLGCVLYNQGKYEEAERPLRTAENSLERAFGKDHIATIDNKRLLGCTIFFRKKDNAEAKRLLRQAAEGMERSIGPDFPLLPHNQLMLGMILGSEQKHSEAERPLRQAADGFKRTMDRDDKLTIQSQHLLAVSLYHQKKYKEAKSLLQRVADGQTRTLGSEHSETLGTMQLLRHLQELSDPTVPPKAKEPEVSQLGRSPPRGQNKQQPCKAPESCETPKPPEASGSGRSEAPRRLRREDYTVGWICALPIELAAAQEMLDDEHGDIERDHGDNDENIYVLGSVGKHHTVIVCLPAGRIGSNPAAAVATQMRSTFKGIRFVLMVGVGGGVPSAEADIRLGDVVVSQPHTTFGGVVQYDMGKTTPGRLVRTGSLNSPPQMLLAAVARVRANEFRGKTRFREHVSEIESVSMFQRGRAGPDVLFEAAYDHEQGQTCELCRPDRQEKRPRRESGQEVVVHYGTIASGNQVMRSASERDRVSRELGGVLCFEMEAAGLMNSFPCLLVRGICDYADSHKNKRWQAYAAATAAAWAKELLSVIPPEGAKARTIKEVIHDADN